MPHTPDALRAARLRRLCRAYGALAPAAVLEVAVPRLRELAALSERDAAIYRADAAYVAAQRGSLLAS